MNIFCRHCWKFTKPELIEDNPHISAFCSECKNFVKHLNKSEKTAALKAGIKVKKSSRKILKNKHPYTRPAHRKAALNARR